VPVISLYSTRHQRNQLSLLDHRGSKHKVNIDFRGILILGGLAHPFSARILVSPLLRLPLDKSEGCVKDKLLLAVF